MECPDHRTAPGLQARKLGCAATLSRMPKSVQNCTCMRTAAMAMGCAAVISASSNGRSLRVAGSAKSMCFANPTA